MWCEVFQTLNLQSPQRVLCGTQWFFVEVDGNLLARRVDFSSKGPVFVKTFPTRSAPAVAVSSKARIHHVGQFALRTYLEGTRFGDVVDWKDIVNPGFVELFWPIRPVVRVLKIPEFEPLFQPRIFDDGAK